MPPNSLHWSQVASVDLEGSCRWIGLANGWLCKDFSGGLVGCLGINQMVKSEWINRIVVFFFVLIILENGNCRALTKRTMGFKAVILGRAAPFFQSKFPSEALPTSDIYWLVKLKKVKTNPTPTTLPATNSSSLKKGRDPTGKDRLPTVYF